MAAVAQPGRASDIDLRPLPDPGRRRTVTVNRTTRVRIPPTAPGEKEEKEKKRVNRKVDSSVQEIQNDSASGEATCDVGHGDRGASKTPVREGSTPSRRAGGPVFGVMVQRPNAALAQQKSGFESPSLHDSMPP
jgi:hypothetical protein